MSISSPNWVRVPESKILEQEQEAMMKINWPRIYGHSRREDSQRNVAQVDRIKPTRQKGQGEVEKEYQNKAGSNNREKQQARSNKLKPQGLK